ncbi:MAG: (d)CMP kinase [Deltaproteobacteria bacterium]|jgi:cytidylate kinase|nr:(d)CMP kinase [Deltaproteobacteria bacterium]
MDSTDVITIDGPAASGKSTLAKRLALRAGWSFLETGALYRGVAHAAMKAGVLGESREFLGKFAWDLNLALKFGEERNLVFLDGEDATDLLRLPGVAELASELSSIPEVRHSLTHIQRKAGEKGRLVTEGRDQGTAIFPEARLKFFLTADAGVRAERRRTELLAKGIVVSPEEVLRDLVARDEIDRNKSVAPLVEPEDSVRIDSSRLNPDEVLEIMLARARETFGENFANP